MSNYLRNYPVQNPVLIAIDNAAYHYLHQLKGRYLRSDSMKERDYSLLYQREVWIIYIQKTYFNQAMQLGRNIQLRGAKKIFVIRAQAALLWEVKHVK